MHDVISCPSRYEYLVSGEPSHEAAALKEGGDKYLAKEGQKLLLSASCRLRHVVTLITVFGMTTAGMGEVLIQDPCVLDFIETGHIVAFDHRGGEKLYVSQ